MTQSPYIVGRHPVLEALVNQQKVDKILISKFAKGEVIDSIKNYCRQLDIHYQIVPEEKLKREFNNLNHQGVAALLSIIEYYELQQLIDLAFEKAEIPFFILLDGVTDVRNIGAIARSALGMGVHGIILPHRGTAPIQADAVKASAGALLNIPVCRVQNIVTAVKDLKLNGIQVIGIHTNTNQEIGNIKGDKPTAIVMGAEDVGISAAVQKEIDHFYKIPIENIDSYNVSVAAALTMYQVMVNRKK